MSTTQDVDGLRASVDLASYIGQYVELKREGNELVACCPFHTEDTPSFKVNSAKQLWACFGCGAHEVHGADVFGFIRSYENCTFPEAIEKLQHGGNGSAPPVPRAPLKKAPKRMLVVPPTGLAPDMERTDLGEPTYIWPILTREGQVWFYEARYEKDGKKETRFWTYGRYSEQDTPRWECKHPPNPRPFYGLEGLDLRPTAQVMIHEAPKKAEAARALFPQQVHVAMLGGAHQVANMDIECLRGRKIILLPDNDEAGRQAMSRLAARLVQELGAESVRGIDPEYQPDGSVSPEAWDVADAQGWTPKIALDWAKKYAMTYNAGPDARSAPEPPLVAPASGSAPETPKPAAQEAPQAPIAPEPIPTPRPNLTVVDGGAVRKPRQEIAPEVEQLPAFSEFALAKRFADDGGQDWRYTAAWASWAKWNGARWLIDEKKRITWDVKKCCTAAMHEHLSDSSPPQRLKLTTLKTVNAVIGLAAADPQIATGAEEWDANPWLLGTPTGIVDLRTGQLVASDKAQLISKSTLVGPAVGEHPLFDMVMARPAKGDAAMLEYLWHWLGYILTGDVREERFMFLHGVGGSGKGTLIKVIADLLGDYARAIAIQAFTESQHQRHSQEIAKLQGARFVYASETEEGSRFDEAMLKWLTGRDKIAAHKMRQDDIEFYPQFKLLIYGNNRPSLKSVGEDMRRRIDLIEFPGTIPAGERDVGLKDKLRAEYPAILASMIRAAVGWQKNGLGKPQSVSQATENYLRMNDVLGDFIEDCLEASQDSYELSGAAYKRFTAYCTERGEKYIMAQRTFSQRMEARGYALGKVGGARIIRGFKLKGAGYEPAPPDWIP